MLFIFILMIFGIKGKCIPYPINLFILTHTYAIYDMVLWSRVTVYVNSTKCRLTSLFFISFPFITCQIYQYKYILYEAHIP